MSWKEKEAETYQPAILFLELLDNGQVEVTSSLWLVAKGPCNYGTPTLIIGRAESAGSCNMSRTESQPLPRTEILGANKSFSLHNCPEEDSQAPKKPLEAQHPAVHLMPGPSSILNLTEGDDRLPL